MTFIKTKRKRGQVYACVDDLIVYLTSGLTSKRVTAEEKAALQVVVEQLTKIREEC